MAVGAATTGPMTSTGYRYLASGLLIAVADSQALEKFAQQIGARVLRRVVRVETSTCGTDGRSPGGKPGAGVADRSAVLRTKQPRRRKPRLQRRGRTDPCSPARRFENRGPPSDFAIQEVSQILRATLHRGRDVGAETSETIAHCLVVECLCRIDLGCVLQRCARCLEAEGDPRKKCMVRPVRARAVIALTIPVCINVSGLLQVDCCCSQAMMRSARAVLE
jgi:hypothetical protein